MAPRDSPSARTPRRVVEGRCHGWNGSSRRSCAAHAGERVAAAGLAAPQARACARVVPRAARPRRAGPDRHDRGARVSRRRPCSRSRASRSRTSRRRAGWRCTSPSFACSPSRAEPPPVELHRPEPRESLPTRLDARAGRAAASGRARALPADRAWRSPAFRRSARRARLHGDPDAEDRRGRDRGRRERLPRRLLRARRLPRAEPAVLQADDGRRLRARLRGRPGLPRRAARHGAPPRRVRLARRRARLHPRPPRRHATSLREVVSR